MSLAAACTLTDESFEPISVSRVDGELSPDETSPAPLAPLAPDEGDEDAADLDPSGTSSEQDLGAVPLDPGEPGPGGSNVNSGSPSSGGASPSDADDAKSDAGVDLPDGEDGSDPGDEPPPPVASCTGAGAAGGALEGGELASGAFGGSCYQLFGEVAPWLVAEQRCLAWGGHLASVESPEEDAFIAGWPALLGLPAGDGSGIWLGGTDAAFEGAFRWSDNAELTFERWAPNQPDNGFGVDCIEKRNDGTALWYDRRCSDALPFVCERPL